MNVTRTERMRSHDSDWWIQRITTGRTYLEASASSSSQFIFPGAADGKEDVPDVVLQIRRWNR